MLSHNMPQYHRTFFQAKNRQLPKPTGEKQFSIFVSLRRSVSVQNNMIAGRPSGPRLREQSVRTRGSTVNYYRQPPADWSRTQHNQPATCPYRPFTAPHCAVCAMTASEKSSSTKVGQNKLKLPSLYMRQYVRTFQASCENRECQQQRCTESPVLQILAPGVVFPFLCRAATAQ